MLSNTCSTTQKAVDRRLELEQLRRSIAMLSPGARDAVGREQALQLLTELHDVQGRLDDLMRRLRELANEEWGALLGGVCPPQSPDSHRRQPANAISPRPVRNTPSPSAAAPASLWPVVASPV